MPLRAWIAILCLGPIAGGCKRSLGGSPARKNQQTQRVTTPPPTSTSNPKPAGAGPRIVLVTAEWCASCHQLKHEVFESTAGKKLLTQATLELIDFDAPSNRGFVSDHAITGLPTVLFLRRKGEKTGTEIDRIEGYDGKRAFISEASAILGGRDGLVVLEDKLRRDPKRVKLLYLTGRKLLLRGKVKAAMARYDRVLALDPADKTGFASKVMMHKARFLVRVKRSYVEGEKLLRQAVARFGNGSLGDAFRYWLSWALCRAGKKAQAVEVVDLHLEKRGRSAKSLVLAAEVRQRCRHDLRAGLALAREAVQAKPRNDWAWYLIAALARDTGKPAEARQAIARAISLNPRQAFYRSIAQNL